MAIAKQSIQEMGAQVRAPLKNILDKVPKTFGSRFLTGLAFAAAFIPLVGIGTSYVIERVKNKKIATEKKEVLAQYTSKQINTTLGRNSGTANRQDLEMASRYNPELNRLAKAIDEEKESANRASGMSNGAAYVAGGLIPGVGGFSKILAETGGAVLGGQVSSIFDEDNLKVLGVVQYIDSKLHAGKPVTANDLVMLRIAKDDQFQQTFKKKYKTPFHKMSDTQKQEVLSTMPEALITADKQAYALNKGLISVQSLAVGGAEPLSNAGSFTAREDARRAATAAHAVSGPG